MTDGSSSAELGLYQNPENNKLPQLKKIRLGEYGRALENIWPDFVRIRNNGIYATDRNIDNPHFSKSIVLHGNAGRLKRTGEGGFTFIPPSIDTIKKITKIGVVSSDLEFEGEPARQGAEEETSGSADFWLPSDDIHSIPSFLQYLREREANYNDYITTTDNGSASATVMFAFDTSRPELAPLMTQAMRDDQSKTKLWSMQFGDYTNFPSSGSGMHLAIPIGLPANYIEYMIVNEKSPHWQGERIQQLKGTAVCDNHPVPLISAHTGAIIK